MPLTRLASSVCLLVLPWLVRAADHDSATGHYPHPLNATMGIPDPVGSYNLRLNTFHQRAGEGSEFDWSGHVGYGLFEWGGIHLRSLGVRSTALTEVIGMVGLWQDEQRDEGVSLLGIIGIPTGRRKEGEEHHGLSYLIGVAGRKFSLNAMTNDIILHYDVTAKHYIAESGTVVRLYHGIFGVFDTRATVGATTRPEVLLMPSLKVSVPSVGFVGVGYNVPLTRLSSLEHQVFVQIEVGSH